MRFTVESIEENIVRLEDETGKYIFVDSSLLPSEVKEGDIIVFDGVNYSVDASATTERRRAVYEKFNKLFRKE